MTAYLPIIAALAGLGWVQADPDRELTAWAVLRGVDPAIVHAVARIETGNVPPDRRDRVVSRTGDVGRLQINAGFWCPRLGKDKSKCLEFLKNRRNNYALGTVILARIQAKYGGRGLTDCRCGGQHSGGWIAHYNGGHTVRKGSRAERYGMKVIKLIRQRCTMERNATISVATQIDLQVLRNLSEYERQVSDAVISLWIEAVKEKLPPIFTPDMIFRAMPGGSDTASPQQKGAITKTIEKFRRLHITVDATEEMRKRGIIPGNATYKIDNFYLSATHAEYKVKNGGQTVNAYRLDAEPIMLTYCRLTSQLLTVPAKYIEIQKVKKGRASGELVTMNADRQAMTGYMLRRIAVMKHDKRNKVQTQSNVILFDTLFAETGTKTDNRKQTMNNRNFCFDVLEYWKATGFIAGYQQQTKGRTVTGIIISL